MSAVPTLTGEIGEDELGMTLIHEHIFVSDPALDRDLPHPEWDAEVAVDAAVGVLEDLAALGVGTVVDLTVPGLGRDVARLREVASRTSVRIIASTGWYTADVLPPALRSHGPGTLVGGPDPLEDLFVRDIERGISDTGVRAGMLKVVSDEQGFTPDVTRVFAAAAAAHRRTGTPITTHSHARSRGGLAQQDLLEHHGVALDRVVIGHSSDTDDYDYLERVADRGSYLGFDRFGMEHAASDELRISSLLAMLDRGYEDRIVLSQDAAIFSRVTPPSWRARFAPAWRMDHLLRDVMPRLREHGVSDGVLRRMLVDNPRRILAVP